MSIPFKAALSSNHFLELIYSSHIKGVINLNARMADAKKEGNLPSDPSRFEDYRNGPVAPSQRECRDVFCCLLFTVNVAAMVALAIYSYTYGNTHNIYRATDGNQDICGQSGTLTENFPLAYFYNPTTGDLSKRICVAACPAYTANGTLTALNCFTTPQLSSCSYTITVKLDGTYNNSGSATSSDVIGYDSVEEIGRVCVPTLTVLKNAFSSSSTTISNGVRQAGLGNFITDLQNVNNSLLRTGVGCCCRWCWQSSFRWCLCSACGVLPAV
jgi:hypothetical protein